MVSPQRMAGSSIGYRTRVQSSRVPLGAERPRGTRWELLVSVGPGGWFRFAVRHFLVRVRHGVTGADQEAPDRESEPVTGTR